MGGGIIKKNNILGLILLLIIILTVILTISILTSSIINNIGSEERDKELQENISKIIDDGDTRFKQKNFTKMTEIAWQEYQEGNITRYEYQRRLELIKGEY